MGAGDAVTVVLAVASVRGGPTAGPPPSPTFLPNGVPDAGGVGVGVPPRLLAALREAVPQPLFRVPLAVVVVRRGAPPRLVRRTGTASDGGADPGVPRLGVACGRLGVEA